MMLPQVTFRGLPPTQTVVASVWRGARALGQGTPQVAQCHVLIEAVKRPERQREHYDVTVRMSGEDWVNEVSTLRATNDSIFCALQDAFDAARESLKLKQSSRSRAGSSSVRPA